MTLKEKFKFPIDANNKINDYVAKQCEEIADEFAAEFLDWVLINSNINQFQYSYKELLEMFKKEKGL
jgi:hypothetical protein